MGRMEPDYITKNLVSNLRSGSYGVLGESYSDKAKRIDFQKIVME